MLDGLAEAEGALRALGVPLFLLQGVAPDVLPAFVKAHAARAVVSDFSPLRMATAWQSGLAAALDKGWELPFPAHFTPPLPLFASAITDFDAVWCGVVWWCSATCGAAVSGGRTQRSAVLAGDDRRRARR